MKLEPWEIDLQNQLNDKSTQIPVVPEPVVPEPVVVEEPVTLETEQKGPGSWAFLILFLVLSLASLHIYDDKTGGNIKKWAFSFFHNSEAKAEKTEKPKVQETKPNFNEDAEVAQLRSEVAKIKSLNKAQYDEIMGKLNTVSNKVVLMGLLLNENFNIIGQNINYGDLIYFNRDWTLDKMPKYIELSDEDRDYLRKFIKEN